MSEEIKEILDKFDKVLENYELDKKWGQMSVDSICHLFPSEMITIKDYITNLQQYYNDNVNKYEELLVKYSDLQQQKENIIKEVREYINWRLEEDQDMYKYQMEELLEILDKKD